MAGILCLCGRVLSNSAVPNDVEYLLVSDHTLDRVCMMTDTMKAIDAIIDESPSVWKCPGCGRMAVFDQPDSNVPTWYRKERN